MYRNATTVLMRITAHKNLKYNGYHIKDYIDGLVQEKRNSVALTMELRLSCINTIDICKTNQKWNFISEIWIA